MSHASHSGEPRSYWQRWTLAVLVLGTLLFGFWGNWLYEQAHHADHPPDAFSVLYYSFQFLIAHGVHLEGSVPWQLHVGRLLGVAALFTAGLTTFAKFFQSETLMWRLWAPWQRDHVVVCGLGDLGLRLALDARGRGKFVVAIEKHGDAARIEQARRSGVLVIEGDACDPIVLRKARVEEAEGIVASTANDATNIAIAAVVGRTLPAKPHRRSPLVCRLLLRDSELRHVLAKEQLFAGADSAATTRDAQPRYHVNFGDLNLRGTAARQVLRRYPLDFQHIRQTDETTVHVVIAGFGPMGQEFALHAVRIGHFANSVAKGRKVRITVVDGDASGKMDEFRSRYPQFESLCDVEVQDADPRLPALLAMLDDRSRAADEREELVTYAICFESEGMADDRNNLRIGLELASLTEKRPVQTLIYQSTRYGLAALFPPEIAMTGKNHRLHAFGMIEDIYSWDVLLHESEDRLARAIHEVYLKNRTGSETTAVPWELLSDAFKESNRHAADHIPIKLRALGYHDAPLEPGRERIEQFSESEMLLLAQLEHRRWFAERRLDGWRYGTETIRSEKISKDLVDWDELPQEERKKDYEQISAIPSLLFGIGRGIYR